MTKAEFKQVFEIANNINIELQDTGDIYGFALPDFKPINTTLKTVAKALRYHALQLNGKWDHDALDEFVSWSKRAFIIVG